jgi:hypothetical protein
MGKIRKFSKETCVKMSLAQVGNKNSVGNKNWLGKHHSEETKLKLSRIRKGCKHSETTKMKMSNAHNGKSHSDSWNKKVSESLKGRKLSEICKLRLSVAMTGNTNWKNRMNYGVSKETRMKLSVAGMKRRHSEATKMKMHEKWNDSEWRSVRLDKLLKNNVRPRYANGFYDSKKAGKIFYRSSYELRMYKLLDADIDVIYYEVEAYEIEYIYDGKIHHYIPDLYVVYRDGSHKHIEVKPRYIVEHDNRTAAKIKAATEILGDNFVIITEEALYG